MQDEPATERDRGSDDGGDPAGQREARPPAHSFEERLQHVTPIEREHGQQVQYRPTDARPLHQRKDACRRRPTLGREDAGRGRCDDPQTEARDRPRDGEHDLLPGRWTLLQAWIGHAAEPFQTDLRRPAEDATHHGVAELVNEDADEHDHHVGKEQRHAVDRVQRPLIDPEIGQEPCSDQEGHVHGDGE